MLVRAGVRRGAGGLAAAAGGFTLLETSLALVIIGVGVLAFVEAQQSFVKNNSWSSQAATGAYLANEIREFSRRLPRHDPVIGLYLDAANGNALVGWGLEGGETDVTDINDVDDLDGITFGAGGYPGPINAMGELVPQTDANGRVLTDDEVVTLARAMQSIHAHFNRRLSVAEDTPMDVEFLLAGPARRLVFVQARPYPIRYDYGRVAVTFGVPRTAGAEQLPLIGVQAGIRRRSATDAAHA